MHMMMSEHDNQRQWILYMGIPVIDIGYDDIHSILI